MVLASDQLEAYLKNSNGSPEIMIGTNSAPSIVNPAPGVAGELGNSGLSHEQTENILDYSVSDAIPSFSNLLTRLPQQGKFLSFQL